MRKLIVAAAASAAIIAGIGVASTASSHPSQQQDQQDSDTVRIMFEGGDSDGRILTVPADEVTHLRYEDSYAKDFVLYVPAQLRGYSGDVLKLEGADLSR